MPFTLAHPAAVLAAAAVQISGDGSAHRRQRYARPAVLRAGAVRPIDDRYPYALRVVRVRHSDRDGGAAVWIPAATAAHRSAERSRPRAVSAAMDRFRDRPLSWQWLRLPFSSGPWTHILWDSFTHDTGWMVRRVSALTHRSRSAGIRFALPRPAIRDSVAGLLVLAICTGHLPAPANGPANAGRVHTHPGMLLLVPRRRSHGRISGLQAALQFQTTTGSSTSCHQKPRVVRAAVPDCGHARHVESQAEPVTEV